jgi:hypothetical protein
MMRICLWTAVTNGPIVHPPGDIWVWMRKPKNLDKNLSQCHFSHHMSHVDWPRQETGKEKVYSMWDEKYQYLTNGWLFLFVDGAKTFLFVTTFSPALSEGGFTKLHSLLPSYCREIEYIENNVFPRCQKYGAFVARLDTKCQKSEGNRPLSRPECWCHFLELMRPDGELDRSSPSNIEINNVCCWPVSLPLLHTRLMICCLMKPRNNTKFIFNNCKVTVELDSVSSEKSLLAGSWEHLIGVPFHKRRRLF